MGHAQLEPRVPHRDASRLGGADVRPSIPTLSTALPVPSPGSACLHRLIPQGPGRRTGRRLFLLDSGLPAYGRVRRGAPARRTPGIAHKEGADPDMTAIAQETS